MGMEIHRPWKSFLVRFRFEKRFAVRFSWEQLKSKIVSSNKHKVVGIGRIYIVSLLIRIPTLVRYGCKNSYLLNCHKVCNPGLHISLLNRYRNVADSVYRNIINALQLSRELNTKFLIKTAEDFSVKIFVSGKIKTYFSYSLQLWIIEYFLIDAIYLLQLIDLFSRTFNRSSLSVLIDTCSSLLQFSEWCVSNLREGF